MTEERKAGIAQNWVDRGWFSESVDAYADAIAEVEYYVNHYSGQENYGMR